MTRAAKSEERLGAFDQRITLECDMLSVGDGGRTVRNTVALGNSWAAVSRRKLAPILRGDRLEQPQVTDFTLHHHPVFETTERVIYGGESHRVLLVESLGGRRKLLRLRCERMADSSLAGEP